MKYTWASRDEVFTRGDAALEAVRDIFNGVEDAIPDPATAVQDHFGDATEIDGKFADIFAAAIAENVRLKAAALDAIAACGDTMKKILTGQAEGKDLPFFAQIEQEFERVTEGETTAYHEDILTFGVEMMIERLSYPPKGRAMYTLHLVE